jgi:hypothetical protein
MVGADDDGELVADPPDHVVDLAERLLFRQFACLAHDPEQRDAGNPIVTK